MATDIVAMEFAAAREIAQSAGFDPTDFEFARMFTSPDGWDIIAGRRSTKVTRSYQDGHRSGWVNLFQADLVAGSFG